MYYYQSSTTGCMLARVCDCYSYHHCGMVGVYIRVHARTMVVVLYDGVARQANAQQGRSLLLQHWYDVCNRTLHSVL